MGGSVTQTDFRTHPDPAQGWDRSGLLPQQTPSGSQRASALPQPRSGSGLLMESDFSQANVGLQLSLEVQIALLTSKGTAVYHQLLLHAHVSVNRDTITAGN